VHAWFVTEWNAGLYPYRRHIYKPPWYHSSAIDTFPLPSTSDMTTAEQALHIDTSHMPIVDANLVSLNHGAPEQHRSVTENAQIQAYLYSLSTPGANHKIRFGTDAEDICIDTGASACISRLRQNFITLRPVKNLAVNGIGSGLPIAGIGTLRWSICISGMLYLSQQLPWDFCVLNRLHSKPDATVMDLTPSPPMAF
jgi:hypothetical protein